MRRRPAPRRKILLVDDHVLVRQSLASVINRTRGLHVCAEAGTVEEAIPLIARLRPDLVITDLTVSGQNGLHLIEHVCAERDNLPVLVLSMQPESAHAVRSFRAGAAGYLDKGDGGELLLAVIRRLLRGAVYASDRTRGRVLQELNRQAAPVGLKPLAALTPAERFAFDRAALVRSTRAVARTKGLRLARLRRAWKALRTKLALPNEAALRHHAQLWRQARTRKSV